VGFVGALLGLWLSRLAGLPDLLTLRSARSLVVWSVIGSALFRP
jgi:uncharacterized membrane protein YeaQ/YmgE (transglycosylase-associated protein family)